MPSKYLLKALGKVPGQCKMYKRQSYIRERKWGRRLMIEFKILTQRYQNKIEEKIQESIRIKKLDAKSWHTYDDDGTTHFIFSCNKKEKENMMQTMANIVSDTVQEEVLDKFASKYLKERKDISKEDRKAIKELFIVSNYMAKEDGVSYISYYVIYLPILREIEKYQHINIEGWMSFRMQKYQTILNDVIEQAIYDYQTQKEYLEYISFIIESKRSQDVVEETMHLIPKHKGEMGLLNHEKEDVTKAYIYKYCEEFLEEGAVKLEDLLLNILITAPPRELIIHRKESYHNIKFIATLETLFAGHLSYCTGCDSCKGVKE